MKKFPVFIIFLFWLGIANGQVQPIEDSQSLTEFEQYVNSILIHKKDTIALDTIAKKYRVVYSTSCYYFEHWMENDGCVFGNKGRSFLNQAPTIDSLSTDAMFAQIKKPYFCAENPGTYNGENAVFILKNGKLFNADLASDFEIDIIPNYGWRYTPRMSYDHGRYLILETNLLDQTEAKLMEGMTTTYFLEFVE